MTGTMVGLEPWDPERHFSLIAQWLRRWGINYDQDPSYYPMVGFVAAEAAAGFLYTTGTSMGYLDSFVSDPHVPKDVRSIAIDMVIQALIEEAPKHGVKTLTALSENPRLILRAETHGFKVLGRGFSQLVRSV
jgi:hypothetical protein